MASIRKRQETWQAQIRRAGEPPLVRSCATRKDAARWARYMELKLDGHSLAQDFRSLERTTLKDILIRYRDVEVPKKKGADVETIIINAFLRHPLCLTSMRNLKASAFADYRDMRLKSVCASTINRELGIVQHALEIAIKEWDIPLAENPVKRIKKPVIRNARSRRLHPEEERALETARAKTRNSLIWPVITFALETGMRRSEILNIEWDHLSPNKRLLTIPVTKNGYSRTIPLSESASGILSTIHLTGQGRPFPLTTESLKLAWKRLTHRAEIDNLHFHDLRHEAISRLFEKGLSLQEVALISGHRDPRMLFRYTHIKPEHVLEKL